MKKLRGFILAFLLLYSFGASIELSFARQSRDNGAIRDVVERFLEAYQRHDVKEQVAMWSVGAPGRTAERTPELSLPAPEKLESKNVHFVRVDQTGDKADVRLVVDVEAVDSKSGAVVTTPARKNLTISLVREAGEWKLWECEPSERKLASEIATAKTEEERDALVKANENLLDGDLFEELVEEGRRLLMDGSCPQSEAVLKFTAKLGERLGDKRTVAICLINLNRVHQLLGEYSRALDYATKGIDTARQISDKTVLAQGLCGAGFVEQRMSNYPAALNYLQECLKVSEAAGDKHDMAAAFDNLGAVYSLQGRYTEALQEFLRGLDAAQASGYDLATAACLHDIGDTELKEGDIIQAREYFLKSMKISEKMGDKRRISMCLNELGSVEAYAGNHEKAVEYYQRSLDLAESLGDKAQIAVASSNIGIVYEGGKDYQKAMDYFQKSLKLLKEIGDRANAADVMTRIAEVYNAQGNHIEALRAAEESASLGLEIGSLEALVTARFIQGKAYRSLKEPEKARRSFDAAIAAIEELRNQVAGAELDRQSFMSVRVISYQEMASLLVEQHDLIGALNYAEQARARTLVDVLESGRTKIGKSMTALENQEEGRLTEQLGKLNSDIVTLESAAHPDEKRLADLDAKLKAARLDLDAFHRNLYAAHPKLQVRRGQFQPPTPKQLGGLIQGTQRALLEYFVMSEKTYLFVLTKKNDAQEVPDVNVYEIGVSGKDLKERAERFRNGLEGRDLNVGEQSRALYRLLLGQAAPALANKTELVIAPDGVLWDLPFQALLSDANRFTIQDYAISYAPSLTALVEMSKPRKTPIDGARGGLTLLAMGNPTIGKETASSVKETFRSAALEPLPRAQDEVETVGKEYGAGRSKVYVGRDATEEKFKEEASNYRIVHLATHGILDDSNPMYSQIVLAEGSDGKDDGVLEAWEIMNLNLSADLVVLSACDTGRGEIRDGEGVIGLSWAVFVAGCPTTVVSQWKVDSESTTALMVAFHRNLLEGKSKAEALREAELKLMNEPAYRHPFYWAPFVVVGNPN